MASVGYVLIEHFAIAVERRQWPEFAGRPMIVGGDPHERKMVYDASAEARAMGVKPGLPLRQAEQLCPTAVFLPLAETRYHEADAAFLAILESFSPAVLPDGLGAAYFDARGLAQLFGVDDLLARRLTAAIHHQLGFASGVGLGPTRFTARVAAQLSRVGAPVVVSASPIAFLSTLPIAYLPGDVAFYDQLRLLGIQTIGQFMALPSAELMEQFGPVGVAAYQLAYGKADPPILPRAQPAALQQKQEFEPALSDPPALTHTINRLSADLATILQRRYQACQTVILRLELERQSSCTAEETAQLREPTSQATTIAAAALRLIERLRLAPAPSGDGEAYLTSSVPNPGITTLQIVVTGIVGQGGTQLGLFDAQRWRRCHLEQAATEVQRRFGDRLKRAARTPAAGSVATPPFVLHNYFDARSLGGDS